MRLIDMPVTARPRRAGGTLRQVELCIDANDPARLRPFWCLALGYAECPQPDGSIDLVDPEGVGPDLWFQRVPEPKVAKNRIHFDVFVAAGERPDLARRLVDLGGTVLGAHQDFTVLADPEGNEICLNDAR